MICFSALPKKPTSNVNFNASTNADLLKKIFEFKKNQLKNIDWHKMIELSVDELFGWKGDVWCGKKMWRKNANFSSLSKYVHIETNQSAFSFLPQPNKKPYLCRMLVIGSTLFKLLFLTFIKVFMFVQPHLLGKANLLKIILPLRFRNTVNHAR